MRTTFSVFIALALCAAHALADELKLKDGTKIVGTIVGFEDNSFKVKTSYGFALIQRDQVVSISVSDSAPKSDADKKAEPTADHSGGTAKQAKLTGSLSLASAQPPAADRKPAQEGAGPLRGATAPPEAGSPIAAASTATPAAASSSGVPTAAQPAGPEPIREEVTGNAYVNDTYGFRMYKPPDWQLIAGARALLPGAITAMGTGDQTTYLLIGRDAAGRSLAGDMDSTEERLREVMDNFRPLGEKRITISGSEAIERRFRGSVDQHDWSGVVVLVPRGTHVYTIFGMTYADNDLVQIQENVISRAISSLQFAK
jgi:hypothetical protein